MESLIRRALYPDATATTLTVKLIEHHMALKIRHKTSSISDLAQTPVKKTSLRQ